MNNKYPDLGERLDLIVKVFIFVTRPVSVVIVYQCTVLGQVLLELFNLDHTIFVTLVFLKVWLNQKCYFFTYKNIISLRIFFYIIPTLLLINYFQLVIIPELNKKAVPFKCQLHILKVKYVIESRAGQFIKNRLGSGLHYNFVESKSNSHVVKHMLITY